MKARSINCRCESNFTCGHCLSNRKPYHFTPSGYSYYFSRMNDEAIARDKKESKKVD